MLPDVCLSVAYIVNIHGAHSYWTQGALGAAGVRRVWAGAGPHRAQWRGHIARLPADSRTSLIFIKSLMFLAPTAIGSKARWAPQA